MITYKEALAIIHNVGAERSLKDECVCVGDIVGRICAEDIIASIANQPFDNSAMDGFAVKAQDLVSVDKPTALEIIAHIAAGDPLFFKELKSGQCYEIMTGAPLPPGCDTVVPVEQTKTGPGKKILFYSIPQKGDHIRNKGEDFSKGDLVLEKGTPLTVGHILVLTTFGINQVKVKKRPKISLISTGKELVDDTDSPLHPGQIYNASKPYLKASLSALGNVYVEGNISDDPEAFKEKLLNMIKARIDVGLSTGAVSVGVHDFVPSILKEIGAEILFHKVAIRPGKPILFAKLPNNGPLYIGLPGNPVSTAVGLRFFVQPLLRALQGLPPEVPQYAVLKKPYNKGKQSLRFFVRATLTHTNKALQEINIEENQQSFKVRPFVHTNVWAVIPENIVSLQAKATLEIYP